MPKTPSPMVPERSSATEEGCSDKEKAFENWMERDVLFAKQVRRECEECGVPCLVNDGSLSLDEMYEQVKELFSL